MRNTILKQKPRSQGVPALLRRSGHGSTAFSTDDSLRQPQDGASDRSLSDQDNIVDIAHHRAAGMFSEPEDARLTGGTRSLMRRMFGLNMAAAAKVTPSLPLQTVKSPLIA